MERLLENKNVVITGANRGIGRTITELFSKQGATIFACSRKKSEEFEKDMRNLEIEYKCTIYPLYFDLQNSEDMQNAVMEIRRKKISVDVLVNNAAILSEYQLFTMMPIEKVKKLFEIDFFAQMELTQLIARMMQRNKRGSIIYLSSIASLDAFFASYDYVACKAAVNAAMKQQARELGKFGIRVNAIAPGVIETDMIKDTDKDSKDSILPAIMLQRFGQKEEVANVAVFLASEMSSYITGQVLRVDGGTNPPKASW